MQCVAECCSVFQCVAVCLPWWTLKKKMLLPADHNNNHTHTQDDVCQQHIRMRLSPRIIFCTRGQCVLQHIATRCNAGDQVFEKYLVLEGSVLQHTATHCNTLQHTATHCNTLQRTATHCNSLQHTATHSQHTATHCNTGDQVLEEHLVPECFGGPAHYRLKIRMICPICILYVYKMFISKAHHFCFYTSVLGAPLTMCFNSAWYVCPICIWKVPY